MAEFENEPNDDIVMEEIINVLIKSYEMLICVIFTQNELLILEEVTRKLQLQEKSFSNRSRRIGDEEALIVKFKHLLQNRKGGNYY
jgi:hypothetical protein